jgi:hypothetical protein
MLHQYHSPLRYYRNNSSWRVQTMKLFIVKFSPVSCYFLPRVPGVRCKMVHLHHLGILAVNIRIFNELLNEQQQQRTNFRNSPIVCYKTICVPARCNVLSYCAVGHSFNCLITVCKVMCTTWQEILPFLMLPPLWSKYSSKHPQSVIISPP